ENGMQHHEAIDDRSIEMLPAEVPPAGLVGRQAEEWIAVDVDVATIDIRKVVVRLRMTETPEERVDAQQRERHPLYGAIDRWPFRQAAVGGVVAHVDGQQQ